LKRDGITVFISAGLGNQLFQYAMGRAVSERLGCPLYLNLDSFDSQTDRSLSLDRFRHKGIFVRSNFWQRSVTHRWSEHNRWAITEKMDAAEKIAKAGRGSIFVGYWQIEKYFVDIADELRKELVLTQPLSPDSQRMQDRINASPSISVHVRRGDYVNNPINRSRFAECSPDYYRRAANLICHNLSKDVKFYLFSDDIDWARSNISLPGEVIACDVNGQSRPYEDLMLMASCSHNIIANSSFSWWSAWLNSNPQKMIISPKTWYLTPELPNDYINAPSFTVIDNL
jgi:Glycosyl transferase family 11